MGRGALLSTISFSFYLFNLILVLFFPKKNPFATYFHAMKFKIIIERQNQKRDDHNIKRRENMWSISKLL
jgi:hypothetical protein